MAIVHPENVNCLATQLENLGTDRETPDVRRKLKDMTGDIDPAELSLAEQHLIESGVSPE